MNDPCLDCGRNVAPCSGAEPIMVDGEFSGGCFGECGQHDGAWEYYMVHDEVCIAAGMVPHGKWDLCVGCLERRLGRELVAADFTPYPINDPDHPWRSERLRSRLTAERR